MAVGTSWTNPASSPPDLTTGQTFTQTAWEDALSNLNYLGGSDGKHGQHGGLPFFRNTADTGKELQMGTVAGGTAGSSDQGWFAASIVAVTFPVAFSATPYVFGGGTTAVNGQIYATTPEAIGTSGCSIVPGVSNSGGTIGTICYLAIGAP